MEASGETILVADDDPYIGKVLTDRLQSLGYRVLLADGGKRAFELLDQHDPEDGAFRRCHAGFQRARYP